MKPYYQAGNRDRCTCSRQDKARTCEKVSRFLKLFYGYAIDLIFNSAYHVDACWCIPSQLIRFLNVNVVPSVKCILDAITHINNFFSFPFPHSLWRMKMISWFKILEKKQQMHVALNKLGTRKYKASQISRAGRRISARSHSATCALKISKV